MVLKNEMDSSEFHCILDCKLFLANYKKSSCGSDYHHFSTTDYLEYCPLCDDFGPMNISSVIHFVEMLEDEMEFNPSKKVVYLVERGRRAFTNGAFLIGAFLILKHGYEPEDVRKKLDAVNPNTLEPFRDATFAPVEFGLHLIDCWRAVRKAMTVGWLQPPKTPGIWGAINVDEYDHYENPLNGDLVEVLIPRPSSRPISHPSASRAPSATLAHTHPRPEELNMPPSDNGFFRNCVRADVR
jgi:hypothetical protein